MRNKLHRTIRTSSIERSVIVSGMQPTGRLHIGNYLGALKSFVELQNSGKYECYFFIADLHSLTEPFDPKEKQKQILELAADFLAAGLDARESVIFLQSKVSAHAELTWIFQTLASMGEMERMTQFKEKSTGSASVNLGLFTYPTLMATDILLYDPKFVPVGEDQKQHLELTRDLARRFNARFGKTFSEPGILLTETPKIMDLRTPEKKMSKSDPNGCLFMDDSPQEVERKIRGATTDSHTAVEYTPHNRPGMSNLMRIYSSLSNTPLDELEVLFKGKGYAEFKISLAKLVSDYFTDFRKKKAELVKNPQELKRVLTRGSAQAAKVANKKIMEAKKNIGLTL